MLDSHLSSAPQPNIVTSIGDRSASGVGMNYVDTYNEAQMAQYNNAYNYWLWQQQLAYNSPKAQVARLKEAGLNPNFNSIDGTGNAQSIPASSGSLRSNIQQNRLNSIASAVNTATGLAQAISKGVNAYKTFVTTPANAANQYRKLLTALLDGRITGQELSNNIRQLTYQKEGILSGMAFGGMFDQNQRIQNSIWYRGALAGSYGKEKQNEIFDKQIELLSIKRDLAKYDLDHIQPAQLAILESKLPQIAAQINYLLAGTGLRVKEGAWKNAKEGVRLLSDLIDAIIPF